MELSKLSKLLMVTSWTDNLVNRLASEVIGKTKKPGVYIDDAPYYVDECGRLSLKPRSQFKVPTVEQLLGIIERYDPEHTVSTKVIKDNIKDTMRGYNIPAKHIELFTHMVVTSVSEQRYPEKRIKVTPVNDDDVDVLAKLCDYLGTVMFQLHQEKVERLVVDLTDMLTLTIYIKDERYRASIKHAECPDVSFTYTPGDYLYINLFVSHYIESYGFYGIPNNLPRPVHTNSDLFAMLGQLLNLLDNLDEFKTILSCATSQTIKVVDESRVRDYVIIKEGKLYGNDVTLGDYYSGAGESLTVDNIIKCKDSNVIIKGSLDKTLVDMISSIAYTVTSEYI